MTRVKLEKRVRLVRVKADPPPRAQPDGPYGKAVKSVEVVRAHLNYKMKPDTVGFSRRYYIGSVQVAYVKATEEGFECHLVGMDQNPQGKSFKLESQLHAHIIEQMKVHLE